MSYVDKGGVMETINLIVAGAGEGVYKNLYTATKNADPNLNMKIAAMIDPLPRNQLNPKIQEILETDNIQLFHPDKLNDLVLPENPAGIVMTPNASHLFYTAFFTQLGIPVYVEKPAVCRIADLRPFLDLASEHQKLVYAAEYCVDGKALGMLAAAGLPDSDPRLGYCNYASCSTRQESQTLFSSLGRPIEIQGKLLEGSGTAGIVDHRAWLLDGKQGGMIRDLLSHLFGPLYDIGLTNGDVLDANVQLGKWEQGMDRGEFAPLQNATDGETYAKMTGKFLTPHGTIRFFFEIGKYWPEHDRSLYVRFENGALALNYEKPFYFTITSKDGVSSACVSAEHYPSLALLDFRQFIEGKTHGHIGRAAAIVRLNEEMRQRGLTAAGLI